MTLRRRTSALVSWPVLIIAFAGCTRHGGVVADLTSPNGKYRVIVQGDVSRPKSMFLEHVVSARIHSANGEVLGSVELARVDSLDGAFSEDYQPARWAQPRVIQFKARNAYAGTRTATLTVENRSKDTVKCLYVAASDLFLLLDLAAGETLSVPASPYAPGPVLAIAAARCDAARAPLEIIENFRNTDQYAPWRGRYVVRVGGGGHLEIGLEPTQPRLKD